MSEKTAAGTEDEPATGLDAIEEALVGSHQEVPSDEDEGTPEGSPDAGPPVPGHRSP